MRLKPSALCKIAKYSKPEYPGLIFLHWNLYHLIQTGKKHAITGRNKPQPERLRLFLSVATHSKGYRMKSKKHEDQTNEEIVKRIQSATDPRDDLEKLYKKNEGLIWRAIKSFRGQSDFDDLKQEAYLIMHEAALKYDPGVGANFATFFYTCLCNGLPRTVDAQGRHIPAQLKRQICKYNRFIAGYMALYGREPTEEEIAQELQLSLEQLQTILKAKETPLSLDAEFKEDEGGIITLMDTTAEPSAEAAFFKLENKIAHEQTAPKIWAEVDTLPKPQADTIRKYYQDGKTEKEIAADAGKSINAINQTRRAALRELKERPTIKEAAALYHIEVATKAESIARRKVSLYNFLLNGSATERAAFYLINEEEGKGRGGVAAILRQMDAKTAGND